MFTAARRFGACAQTADDTPLMGGRLLSLPTLGPRRRCVFLRRRGRVRQRMTPPKAEIFTLSRNGDKEEWAPAQTVPMWTHMPENTQAAGTSA